MLILYYLIGETKARFFFAHLAHYCYTCHWSIFSKVQSWQAW
ncbi:hypothetical protein HMPREF0083_04352 [Aneurinibacillus aneurinilyticus ATCC 12856]|uniref:Uncharacterized protein n=1 Tax=Aneurinibacillus aneurinilyticus ATCC 12856 TaxID=649747 RepID=U1Y5W0_ANEAE|nr:hypothetical protein HMPREF0083_04352 [Aneurinibacillus aneurinilyticus ATCC 12856]